MSLKAQVRLDNIHPADTLIGTILCTINTASPYEVCRSLSQLQVHATRFRLLSDLVATCMDRYRTLASTPLIGLQDMSPHSQNAYYQLRQANAFSHIIDALESLQDPPSPQQSRCELWSIQEHFEKLLGHVFENIILQDGILDELNDLLEEARASARTGLMITVLNQQHISHSDIGNVALWTLQLMRPESAPRMSSSQVMEILG